MIQVDAIIVNYNSGKYLQYCIDSLGRLFINPSYCINVIIVDNKSTDDSLRINLETFMNVKIIKNSTNTGFAAACNQGAKISQGGYLLFLNPDTQLYSDSLERTLSFMELPENKEVGIIGIQLVDEKNNVLKTCVRFPQLKTFLVKMVGLNKIFPSYSHFMEDWDHGEIKEVDQVMGAFFLVRRNVFEQLEGFDDRFFVYFEELDFSLRASKAGWKSIYFSEAQALHVGGGSSNQVKDRRLFYFLRSQIIYGFKHLGLLKGTILFFSTLTLEFFTRIVLSVFRGSLKDAGNTCRAYYLLFKDLKQILRLIKSLPTDLNQS